MPLRNSFFCRNTVLRWVTLSLPRSIYAALFVASGLAIVACGSKKPVVHEPPHEEVDAGPVEVDAGPPPPQSLYDRLGKTEGLTKIVDTFSKNLATDNKFNKRLAAVKGPKLEKLKKDLVDQMCVESGGPENGADCKYEGRFMKEALGPKNKMKEDEWQAMLVDLRAALEEQGVKDTEQQDLAAALGKFRDDVVVAPKGAPGGPKH